MGGLTALDYRPGDTPWHRWDARCKLAAVFGLSLASLYARPAGAACATLLLAVVLQRVFGSLPRLARMIGPFWWLLLFVGLARAVAMPDPTVEAGGTGVTVTREGLAAGLAVGWRLLWCAALGCLLTATTRSAQVTAAVAWFLRGLPSPAGRRTALLMGLMVRFVPLILQQAAEIAVAQQARGVARCRNPVTRIRLLAVPLLRGVLLRADELAVAMAARGYCDHGHLAPLRAERTDALRLAAAAGLAGVMVLF